MTSAAEPLTRPRHRLVDRLAFPARGGFLASCAAALELSLPQAFQPRVARGMPALRVRIGLGARCRVARRERPHLDAVDGTRREAELAAGALSRDHRMHELCRADDRI